MSDLVSREERITLSKAYANFETDDKLYLLVRRLLLTLECKDAEIDMMHQSILGFLNGG